MKHLTLSLMTLSLVLSAAIFGFFYAWVCSTMWGLDDTDARVAIQAMQAMNGSVRNMVFAPAFFGTPLFLAATAALLLKQKHRSAGVFFAISALTYLCGGLLLTMSINVPMNEALGAVTVPTDLAQAQIIWGEYSPKWQFWNQLRTVVSGLSFVLALMGVMQFSKQR